MDTLLHLSYHVSITLASINHNVRLKKSPQEQMLREQINYFYNCHYILIHLKFYAMEQVWHGIWNDSQTAFLLP